MNRPSGQLPFGEVERSLFRIYVNCSLSLNHPRQLYQEYDLTYEDLALIAGCSVPTMERWMGGSREPTLYKDMYLRRLGEFHFLLTHYQQIPYPLWESACPLPPRIRAILFPEISPEG
ncbi:helix-turn-helix transcriptional regulator [Oscillatoria sp. FACHB-1407]|uniref:helix-turn-helix domain-containing protein n=1 Tax=Oscillatoria sp. FACHB-1407 TaxID=2692847 RepID=UPI00168347E2|nr:helix-turn-helix transcriptional regulator [Oscillatoria sp. FACHB-1407]MBD2463954.1 helix-turn-helix transcriptional regulator [Oscillatoria sp. FACHB-1407]